MNLKIALLGPPGSGKGTQAKKLSSKFDLEHISTGDILRDEVAKETELGEKAKEYMKSGELVPDDLVISMIEERISNKEGYVLDGFPRTIEQAEKLEEISDLHVVTYLDVGEEELLNRLANRRSCKDCGTTFHLEYGPPQEEGVCDECGGELHQREDDSEEVVRERLEVYEQETKPLIEYYQEKGKLIKVDGEQRIDKVFISLIFRIDHFRSGDLRSM